MTVSIYDVLKASLKTESVIQSLKEARLHSYDSIESENATVFEFDAPRATGLSGLGIFRNNLSVLNSGGIYALYAKYAHGYDILLYVGETDNLHRRILEHYSVSTKYSAMKKKLKIFAREAMNPFSGNSEEELNDWMKMNVYIRCIGYKHHSLIEKYVINALNPLLNDDKDDLNPVALDSGFLSRAGLFDNKSLNPFVNSSALLGGARLSDNKDSPKPVMNSSGLLSGAGLFNSIR